MDLRDLAAQEASALLADALGAYVTRTSTELRALRDVIDTLDGSLREQPSETEAAGRLAAKLSQAAKQQSDAAVAAVRRETEAALAAAHHEATTALAAAKRDAEAALAKTRAALTARQEELGQDLNRTTQELAAARKQIEALGFERDASRREAAQLKKQVEAAAGEHGKLVAALEKAKTLLKDTEAERRSLASQLEAVNEQLDGAERANEEHEGIHLTLQARLEAAAATVATLNREVEEAHAKAARAKRDADAAAQASLRDQVRRATQGRMHQITGILQKIKTSESLESLLAAIVEGLATEFSRVALFRVNGSRLEGVHQVRLAFESDISNVVIPLTMDSLLAQAVGSGRVEGFPVSELADRGGAPFGGTPAFVLAMPINGPTGVAAVVYADDSDQPEASLDATTHKRTFAELLWTYSAPQVASLPLAVKEPDAKAISELRNYATLLLDEIEYVYHADETAGRRGDDLRSRLADNLECARRIYSQRVATEGPSASGLLDEQLGVLLAARAETGFGDDLRAVAYLPQVPGHAARSASAS